MRRICGKEGLGKEEALRAVTINAAEICNVSNRVGSLETGKMPISQYLTETPTGYFTNIIYNSQRQDRL